MEIHFIKRNIDDLKKIFKELSKIHSLIHIHSNNHSETFKHEGKDVPEAMEVTLLLNKYIQEKDYSEQAYAIPNLDQPCNRKKEDPVLNFFY